jgi:hypothetical protein
VPGWSDVADFYTTQVLDAGKQPLVLLLVAFVVGFLLIRLSTRMIRAGVPWWPGNVEPGGLHVHHVVFGVVLMLVAGVGGFSTVGGDAPWAELFAAAFGVGAALVLDEFALILHLQDVYWTEEGRTSVDAVMIAVALTVLVVVGFSPLGVAEARHQEQSGWGVVATLALHLAFVVVTFLRGKIWVGAVGLVVPLVALVGALRLARPRSPWARARYAPGSRKARRAEDRDARVERRWRRRLRGFGDLVAGRPGLPRPPE